MTSLRQHLLHKAQVTLTPEQRYEARMAMRGRDAHSAEDNPGGENGSRYAVYEENCPSCGHPLHGIHRVRPNGSVDERAVSYHDDANEAEEVASKKTAEAAYKSMSSCPCCGDRAKCDCGEDCAHCDCNRPLKKAGVDDDTKERGVMVALYPSPKVARSLAIPGGEDPKEIHLTLAYLGKIDDLTPAQASCLKNAVKQLATKLAGFELQGRISGLGYFQQPDSDQEVLYASVDVPGLAEFRQRLINRLVNAGVPVWDHHGNILKKSGNVPSVVNLRYEKTNPHGSCGVPAGQSGASRGLSDNTRKSFSAPPADQGEWGDDSSLQGRLPSKGRSNTRGSRHPSYMSSGQVPELQAHGAQDPSCTQHPPHLAKDPLQERASLHGSYQEGLGSVPHLSKAGGKGVQDATKRKTRRVEDWLPHMTLTYQKKGTPRPKRATPLPEVTFTRESLVCKLGAERHTFTPGDSSCPDCGFEDCRCIELSSYNKSLRQYIGRR